MLFLLIGHEKDWHRFTDVTFSSHYGVPDAAAAFYDEHLGSPTLAYQFLAHLNQKLTHVVCLVRHKLLTLLTFFKYMCNIQSL